MGSVQEVPALTGNSGRRTARREAKVRSLPTRTAPLAAASVAALLRTLERRDRGLAAHCEAVVDLALQVAAALAVPRLQLREVEHTALLHDIGKVGLPESILDKPGPLSDREWATVRRHTKIGARLVAAMPGLGHLAPLVRASHERWDGSGYPDGLRGEEIPLVSRIVFVCDAFDAMTTTRSYRRALPRTAALRELRDHASTQFCPTCVEVLTGVVRRQRTPPRRRIRAGL